MAKSLKPEIQEWLDQCPVSYQENDVIENSLWIILDDAVTSEDVI
tara:strand:- start:382 stop:516 length:135 start_codon:yes stop_codon:yes gene_type:complete